MSVYLITVPREVISKNEYLRMHWRERNDYNKLWDYEIMAWKTKVHRAYIKRCVKIIAYRKRYLDPDNIVTKPIIDSLVVNGLLLNDDKDSVEHKMTEQVKIAKGYKPKTEILIEDIIPERSKKKWKQKKSG